MVRVRVTEHWHRFPREAVELEIGYKLEMLSSISKREELPEYSVTLEMNWR